MIKHTPEPWSAKQLSFFESICDSSGNLIADTCFSSYGGRGDLGKANARRIVACVNALADLTTEQIEDGAFAKMRDDRDFLIKQNSEMLEELVITLGSLKEICSLRQIPLPESTIRRAEVAIAKAKGGAA